MVLFVQGVFLCARRLRAGNGHDPRQAFSKSVPKSSLKFRGVDMLFKYFTLKESNWGLRCYVYPPIWLAH